MNEKLKYFAAASREDIGNSLWGKLERITQQDYHGAFARYANAYSHYYGVENGFGITMGVTRGGEAGELATVRVNTARSLAKALLALVLAPGVDWRPMAKNGDAGSSRAVALASMILEDEWKTRHFESNYSKWVEQALAFSRGYLFPEWDWQAGKATVVDETTGEASFEGDISYHNVLPWDVYEDPSIHSQEQRSWIFLRLYKSKWDLAKYFKRLASDGPEVDDDEAARRAEEEILNSRSKVNERMRQSKTGEFIMDDSDIVPVYYFFHKPTASLPFGRETIMLSPQCVLRDRNLGGDKQFYSEIPVYSLSYDEMFDSPFSWTSFWDALGPQELMDSLETSLATNMTTFGVQCIAIEKGSENSPSRLANGLAKWEYRQGGTPPAPLQLTKSPPEAFKHIEELRGNQRQLMGLNDVALGQPQSAQMNAQAFAVLASMAVQQASPFQKASATALSKVGKCIINLRSKYQSTERILRVTGETSQNLFKEEKYLGQELSPIGEVPVDIGNPMEQTPQGRMALLEIFQKNGMVKTPEQVKEIVDTGRIESTTRAERDEMILIRQEYQDLMRGEKPPVHAVHNHILHFRENAAPLYNPSVLEDPNLVRVVWEHLSQHYLEQWGVPLEGDPVRGDRLAAMLGRPLPSQIAPQPMPPPGPMPGDQGGAPPEMPPALGSPVELPEMPTNPVTGQQFDATGGGAING